jgi:hypothetical protein
VHLFLHQILSTVQAQGGVYAASCPGGSLVCGCCCPLNTSSWVGVQRPLPCSKCPSAVRRCTRGAGIAVHWVALVHGWGRVLRLCCYPVILAAVPPGCGRMGGWQHAVARRVDLQVTFMQQCLCL